MKKMLPFALFAMLCCAAGASSATVHIECKNGQAKCAPPPTPPAPPAPPSPPAPPAPPAPPVLAPDGQVAGIPAVPAIPAVPGVGPLPAIPAPPPPPKLPPVPAEAHAACATKQPGSQMTWVIREGETMTGVCQRENGKMVFSLRSYHLD